MPPSDPARRSSLPRGTALAVELRLHVYILDPDDVSREGVLSSSQVRLIRERLEEEDANNPITVAELAQREGLSVRHFSRLFRVSTGKAVSDYVAEEIGRAHV